jgi:hypothetical protein
MQQRHRVYEGREQLVTRVKAWLNELPRGTVLEAVPAPTISLNGAPAHVVGTLRSEIAKLASQHHAIRVANAPLDDAKRQVRELVETLRKRGAPRISTQFGKLAIQGFSASETFGPIPFAVVVEFLCWFDPNRMVEALECELEAMPVSADALPISERGAKLAEIESEIAILECREEAVIERAQRDGIDIPRRHDQSPQSILGVRVAAVSGARAA